jgi:hypothetical protein
VSQRSFLALCFTNVNFRDGKIETHPENIEKYMDAVKTVFGVLYPSLQILDVHKTV